MKQEIYLLVLAALIVQGAVAFLIMRAAVKAANRQQSDDIKALLALKLLELDHAGVPREESREAAFKERRAHLAKQLKSGYVTPADYNAQMRELA